MAAPHPREFSEQAAVATAGAGAVATVAAARPLVEIRDVTKTYVAAWAT